MSLQMAASQGFVVERQFTTPALADVQVAPDGHVLGWPSEEEGVGHSMHLRWIGWPSRGRSRSVVSR